jgi:chlorite dismutase
MPTAQSEEARRQVVTFTFFRLMPEWRRLPASDRAAMRDEMAAVIKKWSNSEEMTVHSYSSVGLRAKCDFFLWRICYSPDCLQSMYAEMMRTGLAGYLTIEHSMLGTTRRSQYKIGKPHYNDAEAGLVKGGSNRYLTVFPYVKSRTWYQLPFEERQRIVREFIGVGEDFPRARMNTLYSFGIDDQDFIVVLESDNLSDFVDAQMRLRETQNSAYTERVTPVFCGIRCTPEEMLERVG